jgi:hypothetical protein
MASALAYLLIETGYTGIQWLMVAPLTVLAFRREPRRRTLAGEKH